MKKLARVLWGIALIGIGAAFVLRIYGVLTFDVFEGGWWTLGIIIPCLITLITEKRKAFSLAGIAIGLILFSGFRGLISFDRLYKLIIPVAVIILGFMLIFKDIFKRKTRDSIKNLRTAGYPLKKCVAIFSSENAVYADEKFFGAELVTVFGGIECDIRNANITNDILINATGLFGGIDIYVPENVNVEFCSVPIFGSVSNKAKRHSKSGNPTVYVNGICVFGGVDIK